MNAQISAYSLDAPRAAPYGPVDRRRKTGDKTDVVLPPDLVVSVHVALSALEEDWRLLEASNRVSMHQSYDWCASWLSTHVERPLLVRGRLGDRTIFILPLELIRNGLFRTARLIASPHSNINTGLFAEDLGGLSREQFAAGVMAGLSAKLADVADIVTLDKLPLEWRGEGHPLAALPSIRHQNSSYQLPLFPDFSATLAQINAKRRRKKFRVSERRMESYGGYDYIVGESLDERRAILDVFLIQKAARFEALGLPNVFRDAATQAFLRAAVSCTGTAENHPLALHALRLRGDGDSRIVAVAGVSRKGDHMICQFGSIDETLAADASPGELLFHRIIERACGEGVALFDFGIGDQLYKRSWCTIETPLYDIVVPLTLRGRIAAGVHRVLVRLKRAIKANRQAYGLVQRLRQKHQGKTAPESGASDTSDAD
ncbi:CelD/BcsL family acetyltransferase involved in cellulose biosynthesis [Rhizobium sp. PP-F2F-G48]|uniref:GNAT family N-acetyltransferase n=1 Tax=Rhizobium sp. PP-F2F-G48 TaxID=2135651 RepID=UPI00104B6629|nr:GNAT family N-acetyltransferase [Rhizobium sp. PP-F2F-G48]TCM57591.1 CelD/BcsL family acetyltransferase involved in cellulose biosynthesis [Rhizobium sp. PP-F2F-G48]